MSRGASSLLLLLLPLVLGSVLGSWTRLEPRPIMEPDIHVSCVVDRDFHCEDGSKCVHRDKVCDQRSDCPDSSDERVCAPCIVPSEIKRAFHMDTIPPGTEVTHGTRINMYCKSNFTLIREGPSVCYNGTWRHYFRCEPAAPCIVREIENGRNTTLEPHGVICGVDCDDNYRINSWHQYGRWFYGRNIAICNNGTWDYYLQCLAPCIVWQVENGRNTTLASVPHGASADVECQETQDISGDGGLRVPLTRSLRQRCNNGTMDNRCDGLIRSVWVMVPGYRARFVEKSPDYGGSVWRIRLDYNIETETYPVHGSWLDYLPTTYQALNDGYEPWYED